MHRIIISMAALALLLAACAGGAPQTVTATKQADGISITLEHPAGLVALRDYELTVSLADAQGKPIDGAVVFLDTSMPGMTMGANQPIADPLGGGRYRVKAVYSMDGTWLVTVHARVGGTEHTAPFELPVALPT